MENSINNNKPKKLYLASAYTPVGLRGPFKRLKSWWLIRKRIKLITKMAAQLMDEGYIVFSPVTHSHYIAKHTKAHHLDHEYWMRQDLPILKDFDILAIYYLRGWSQSKGIARELKFARENSISIKNIYPESTR